MDGMNIKGVAAGNYSPTANEATNRPELKIVRPQPDSPFTMPTPLAERLREQIEPERLELPTPQLIDAVA